MKKILVLVLVLCMLTTMCACGMQSETPAAEAPAPETSTADAAEGQITEEEPEKAILSLAAVHALDTPVDLMCNKFCDILNDSGLFDITYYGQGQYGTMPDVMEAVLAGDNVISIGGPLDLGDSIGIKDLGAMMAPFQYEEIHEIYAITGSDWWTEICDQCYDSGVKIITGNMIGGARYFFTHKEVVNPSDMVGMKFRTPTNTNYMNIFAAFGATPVSIPVGDLYTALSNGTVDAFEFPLADAYAWQLNEVSEYVSNQSYLTAFELMFVSTDIWESLSPDQQEVINNAIDEVCEYGFGIYEEKSAEAVQLLKDSGLTFYDVNVDAYKDCVGKYYELSDYTDGLQERLAADMAAYRETH